MTTEGVLEVFGYALRFLVIVNFYRLTKGTRAHAESAARHVSPSSESGDVEGTSVALCKIKLRYGRKPLLDVIPSNCGPASDS